MSKESHSEPGTEFVQVNTDVSSQNALDGWGTDGGAAKRVVPDPGAHGLACTIHSTVVKSLNQQILHEQCNAHTYEAVSLYFGRIALHGIAAFMMRQAEEERQHAWKLIRHAVDRKARVELGSIPAPDIDYTSPLEAAVAVAELERTTSQLINQLYQLARDEGDYALEVLLHWYITEQIEEEKWSQELVELIERLQDKPGSLYMLDDVWGKRLIEK